MMVIELQIQMMVWQGWQELLRSGSFYDRRCDDLCWVRETAVWVRACSCVVDLTCIACTKVLVRKVLCCAVLNADARSCCEGEARLLDRHHRIAERIFGIYSNMRRKVRWLCSSDSVSFSCREK